MWLKFKPSNWDVAGSSYQYNGDFWPWSEGLPKMKKMFAGFGVGNRPTGWVPEPSRYILMFEPPAQKHKGAYVHWHYAPGRSDVPEPELQSDSQRFISPILFIRLPTTSRKRSKPSRSIRTSPQQTGCGTNRETDIEQTPEGRHLVASNVFLG